VYVPVSTCSSGTWGTARAAHWHARPGEHHSRGTWGTARAALRGGRAREHCSSGTWWTARAAQRGACARELSFSGIGKNAHYRAKVQEALAHWDIRLPEAWAPT
jgi:hypothetical protein